MSDDEEPLNTHAEIQRLSKLIPALKLPEDEDLKQTLEKRILELKKRATSAKPLEEQISILQSLVERKEQKMEKLKDSIAKAQLEVQTVGAEMEVLKQELSQLKQRHLASLDIQPVQAPEDQQAQLHIQHQNAVIADMAAQMQNLQAMLMQIQAQQVPVSHIPAPGTPPGASAPGAGVAGVTPGRTTTTGLDQHAGLASPSPPVHVEPSPTAPVSLDSSASLSSPSASVQQPPVSSEPTREAAAAAAMKEQRRANRETTSRSPRRVRSQSPDLTREEIVAPLFQKGATKGQ